MLTYADVVHALCGFRSITAAAAVTPAEAHGGGMRRQRQRARRLQRQQQQLWVRDTKSRGFRLLSALFRHSESIELWREGWGQGGALWQCSPGVLGM
jgi:hypothetical protein